MKLDFKTYRVFFGFKICGNMSHESMKEIVSENRIKTLRKQGYITRIPYQDPHISREKSQYTYRLTKKGRKFCKDVCHLSHLASSRNMERHNTKLSEIYSHLPPSEQITCMNESDLKAYLYEQATHMKSEGKASYEDYLEKLKEISLIDMTYTNSEGEFVCVEIITSNYNQKLIEQKEATAELLFCNNLEFINIK